MSVLLQTLDLCFFFYGRHSEIKRHPFFCTVHIS